MSRGRKFEMPCLKKYWFYENGEVQNKITDTMKKPNDSNGRPEAYSVYQDDGRMVSVTRKEIIQYGKHYFQAIKNSLRIGDTYYLTIRPIFKTTRYSQFKNLD